MATGRIGEQRQERAGRETLAWTTNPSEPCLCTRARVSLGAASFQRVWERRLPSVLFRKPERAGSRPRWLSALPLITSSMAIRGVVLTAFTAPPAEAAIDKASSLTLLGSWQTRTMSYSPDASHLR